MTRQALDARSGETRRGSIGEANDIAVGRQADAPSTLVTPSLLSDSREAIETKQTHLAARPALGGVYPVDERAFHVVRARDGIAPEHFRASDRATLSSFPAKDRDDAYAMVLSLNQIVKHHVERAVALSLPQTGVDRDRLCKLVEHHAPHFDEATGIPIGFEVEHLADALIGFFGAALTPKVIDRDIEGETPDAANFTYVVQHNPNCPSPYLVRLSRGIIDMKPYEVTNDAYGFGQSFQEAFASAIRALASPSLHGGDGHGA